jgi:LSD1 subclass zinc finger protein
MDTFLDVNQSVNQELACCSCGATLTFQPGTKHISCEYCGASNEIESSDGKTQIIETDLEKFLVDNFDQEERISVVNVQCDSCGAVSTLPPNVSSENCAFCSAPLVVESGGICSVHKPQYLLPFGIDAKKAHQNFKKWISKLWFAPNKLKEYAEQTDRFKGIYVPFWTYDCDTLSKYTGQRGTNYQTTQSYTAVENGKPVTRTRTVTKIRWQYVSGKVSNVFDDILVPASRSLNKEKLEKLEPWDLHQLVEYNDKYLSGFRTENYQVSLKEGYTYAKEKMQSRIEQSIRRDIGGDHQRINSIKTDYNNPKFKHILLPVWISAYKYQDKVYQFLVNARTGEVQGQRPYSAGKIAVLVIFILFAIGVLIYFNR